MKTVDKLKISSETSFDVFLEKSLFQLETEYYWNTVFKDVFATGKVYIRIIQELSVY